MLSINKHKREGEREEIDFRRIISIILSCLSPICCPAPHRQQPPSSSSVIDWPRLPLYSGAWVIFCFVFFLRKRRKSCRRHFGNIPNIQTVITRRHFRVVGGCIRTSPHTSRRRRRGGYLTIREMNHTPACLSLSLYVIRLGFPFFFFFFNI